MAELLELIQTYGLGVVLVVVLVLLFFPFIKKMLNNIASNKNEELQRNVLQSITALTNEFSELTKYMKTVTDIVLKGYKNSISFEQSEILLSKTFDSLKNDIFDYCLLVIKNNNIIARKKEIKEGLSIFLDNRISEESNTLDKFVFHQYNLCQIFKPSIQKESVLSICENMIFENHKDNINGIYIYRNELEQVFNLYYSKSVEQLKELQHI